MNFRYDINALRALAVTSVVLFHFMPDIFPGGFIGVDVFFVISGFLMTKIIFIRLEQNSFCMLDFLVARFNRIVPVLLFVIVCVLLISLILVGPIEYKNITDNAISSLLFYSNVTYWMDSGYFNERSLNNWLLHTWSLSVEWQFYVLFPIIISVVYKLSSKGTVKYLILLATIFNFFVTLLLSSKYPSASYFLLPTRAWEMLAGSCIYFIKPGTLGNNAKVVGISCLSGLFVCVFAINQNMIWPGIFTLLPVVFTCSILYAEPKLAIFKIKPIETIGLWSYSIYLWHWPLVVYGYVNEIQTWQPVGILLSLVLSFVTYNFIELKSLSKPKSYFSLVKSKLTIVLAFVLSCCFILNKNISMIYGMPDTLYNIASVDQNTDRNAVYAFERAKQLETASFKDNYKPNLLVIGDSQSADIINSLDSVGILKKYNASSILIPTNCRIVGLPEDKLSVFLSELDVNSYSKKECESSLSRVLHSEKLRQANSIILSMDWNNEYFEDIKKSIDFILRENSKAKIYIISNKSFEDSVPRIALMAFDSNVKRGSLAYSLINDNYSSVKEFMHSEFNFERVVFIDLLSLICRDEYCTIVIDDNPIYFDSRHLTRSGAEYLGMEIKGLGVL